MGHREPSEGLGAWKAKGCSEVEGEKLSLAGSSCFFKWGSVAPPFTSCTQPSSGSSVSARAAGKIRWLYLLMNWLTSYKMNLHGNISPFLTGHLFVSHWEVVNIWHELAITMQFRSVTCNFLTKWDISLYPWKWCWRTTGIIGRATGKWAAWLMTW